MKNIIVVKDSYLSEYRLKIGNAIREIREKRGCSQDELAEKIEVNRSTISKIECGKFSISIDYLVKIGLHLDFDFVLIEKLKENK